MTEDEIIEKTEKCIRLVLENEGPIITNTINERSICHKFAEYLQKQEGFSEYYVDVEYNRDYSRGPDQPKYLKIIRIEFEDKEKEISENEAELFYKEVTTYPDIIIHKRLTNDDNLLVIEVKKDNNKSDWSIDLKKLEGFTTVVNEGGYGYTLGSHVTFLINKKQAIIQWYREGRKWGKERIIIK